MRSTSTPILATRPFIGRRGVCASRPTPRSLSAAVTFNEDRGNGTPLQENSTEAGYIAAGGTLLSGDGSDWQATIYSQLQTFTSTFSRIANDRNSEALTLDQEVPSTAVGGSLQWTKHLFPMHLLTAGIDARWIDGESDEDIFNFAGTSRDHPA